MHNMLIWHPNAFLLKSLVQEFASLSLGNRVTNHVHLILWTVYSWTAP